jgi:thiol-disulfide isomerase/thioredoxin
MDTPNRRLHPLWILVIAMPLLGIAVALLAMQVTRPETPTPAVPTRELTTTMVGQAAPNFVLAVYDSAESLRLSSLRGQPVVLNFWASWCEPCRREFPALAAFADTNPELRILAVNVGETAAQIETFLADNDLARFNVQIVYDSDFAIHDAYGVDFLPSTYVIDARGIVTAFHYGEITSADLADYVAALG